LRGQIEIHSAETRWIARGLTVIDPGYLIFWKNIEDEKELPKLKLNQVLELREIEVEAKKTQAPSRYSEAKLVQLMEKLGIGRPSTYASTVMTLRDRDYVVIESEVLAPTSLGMATDEVLAKAMPDLVDVRFTAQMEKSLDEIAEDKIGWEKFLCDWNKSYLDIALVKARSLIQTLPTKKYTPSVGKRNSFKGRKSKKKKVETPLKGAPPDCNHGHGPLKARVSKKGDTYWKCAQSGCDSWAWPGRS
jgi:DNA topoisomerase-1